MYPVDPTRPGAQPHFTVAPIYPPQYYYVPAPQYMPVTAEQPMQQVPQQQPARQRKILSIEDPTTHQAINLEDVQKNITAVHNDSGVHLKEEVQRLMQRTTDGTKSKPEVKKKADKKPLDSAKEETAALLRVEVVPVYGPVKTEEPKPEIASDVAEVVDEVTTRLENVTDEDKAETEIAAEPTDISLLRVNPADEEELSCSFSVEVVPETDDTNHPVVSPSVDDEEEKKRQLEMETERVRQREEELNALHAKLMQDKSEFDLDAMRYNRRFLYCVRDIEKEFNRTKCPLTPEQLKAFGVDLHSTPKPFDGKKRMDFNPPWIKGGSKKNQYSGRNSHDHRGGRGGKKPYNSRVSIERPVENKVSLGNKAENAWKAEKIKPEDLAMEENRIKVLLKTVRSLLNKITPTTKEDLLKEWISLKVSGDQFDASQEQLAQVVDIMFDKAVEEPKFCSLYSEICKRQVDHEVRHGDKKSSVFRNALLNRSQTTFVNKSMDDQKKAVEEEQNEEKKKQMAIDYEEAFAKFRRRKFGNIQFIGMLYGQQLLSTKIISWCLYDLLRHTYTKDGSVPQPPFDDESLHCATQLIEVVGQTFERCQDFPGAREYFNQLFNHLKTMAPRCSPKIKFKIMGIVELRENHWRQRKTVEQGPKKLSEIHKDIQQEQAELANQRETYERKHSTGVRAGSSTLRRNAPPPSRSSLDSSVQKRAGAASASKLAPTTAAPRAMMSVSQASNASNKKSWKTGSQGGGHASDCTGRWGSRKNEFRKNSNVDERKAAIAAAQAIGGRRSNSQMSINSQEGETEKSPEIEAAQAKITNSISSDLGELESGEYKLEEFVKNLLDYEGSSRYGEPTLIDVFHRVAECYVTKIKPSQKSLVVEALNAALQGKKKAVIDGFVRYCTFAVKQELWEDKPNFWDVLAELVADSVMHEPTVSPDEDTPRPEVLTLNDFSPVFVAAAADPRQHCAYYLFICVLRILAESFAKKEASEEMLMGLAMDYENLACHSSLDKKKLDAALKACSPDVTKHSNLFELVNHY